VFRIAEGGEKIVAQAFESSVIYCHGIVVSSATSALSIVSIPRQPGFRKLAEGGVTRAILRLPSEGRDKILPLLDEYAKLIR